MPVQNIFAKDNIKYFLLFGAFLLGSVVIAAAYLFTKPVENSSKEQIEGIKDQGGSFDEECKKFEFDKSVGKWQSKDNVFVAIGDAKGTMISGDLKRFDWSVGASIADGIVVKAGENAHYPQVGEEGTIEQKDHDVEYVLFCAFNGTTECGDSDYAVEEGECAYLRGDPENCIAPYGGECKYCSSQCKEEIVKGPYCGDGVVNGQEECDDANSSNNDLCLNTCERPNTKIPYCGDENYKPKKDECSFIEGDAQICFPEYGKTCEYCSYACKTVIKKGPYCGDGVTNEPNESCDDGNSIDNDQCKNDCTLPESVENKAPVCTKLTYKADKDSIEGIHPADTYFNFISQGYDPDKDDRINAYQFIAGEKDNGAEVLNVVCSKESPVPVSLYCKDAADCKDVVCGSVIVENRISYTTVSGIIFPEAGDYLLKSRIQDDKGRWSEYAVK